VVGQKLRVGLPHAGKVVTVLIDRTCFQALHDGAPLQVFPRAIHQEASRHKAMNPRQATRQDVQDHPEASL
jgi:hypothetical protein